MPITGRCVCEHLRYELSEPPLFTHACHCLECQRRTGTAFSMTTIIMKEDLNVLQGELASKQVSSRSTVYSCIECDTAIYTESTAFPVSVILRAGTLDDTNLVKPQAHIWVHRKQEWLTLPDDVPTFEGPYDFNEVWPQNSLDRMRAADDGSRKT